MGVRVPGAGALGALRRTVAERWLDRHVPLEAPRIHLHRRRLFILPTRLGYGYGVTVVLLLLGSLNYGTSLGFAITFLLAGAGALAMVHTYRNLEGIELTFAAAVPVFAGGTLRFPVRIEAPGPIRWGIELAGSDADPAPAAAGPGSPARPALGFRTRHRGRFRMPRTWIATTWPFALFQVWSWIWPRAEGLVYPAPVDHGRPMPEPAGHGLQHRDPGSDDDFAGLREYRPGDPPRRIAWMALARADELLVKSFAGSEAGDWWLTWSAAADLAPEARLEQLSHWVVRAEAAGLRYGLRLPDRRVEPGRGDRHRARCLEALAIHGEAKGAPP